MSKRIIAVFSTIVILFSCCFVPASATPGGAIEYVITNLWAPLTGNGDIGPNYWGNLLSEFLDDGKTIENATPADWKKAYDGYSGHVKTGLGTTQVGKTGYYIYPTFAGIKMNSSRFGSFKCDVIDASTCLISVYGGTSGSNMDAFFYPNVENLAAPVNGYYTFGYRIISNITNYVCDVATSSSNECPCATRTFFNAGSRILVKGTSTYSGPLNIRWPDSKTAAPFEFSVQMFVLVEPTNYSVNNFTQNIGGIDSRVGSITGDYGILGDNGTIIKSDTQYIINETNNTYTNPATNETTPITNWMYDYSDRSYKVITDSGNTVTITYGDENVSIKEGDTIYNIYYISETPGGGGEPTDPDHKHSYTSSVTTAPTCLSAGVKTFTCSDKTCNHTYTEKIPATGHIWVVSRVVQTAYDDTGALLQQGYTIYKCSVCGEEYKDDNGTGPPGGGGTGGEESGDSIWDKLGKLIGSIFDGIISMVGGIVGKILDALTALVDMINEKLVKVVETALSIFDVLPTLFGGFLGLLGAVFPFIPEDLMTVLTFGIIAVVAIGIIKAVRR